MKIIIFLSGIVFSAHAFATTDFVLFFCGTVHSSSGKNVYTSSTQPMDLQDGEKTYLAEWSMDAGRNWGRCAQFTGTASETLRLGLAVAEADWIQDADADCAFVAQNLTEYQSYYKDLRPGDSAEVQTSSTSYHVYYAQAADRIGDISTNAEKYCKGL